MPRAEILPIKPVTDSQSAFAFLLGVLFNQQMRGTMAWQAPQELRRRVGSLDPQEILVLGQPAFAQLFAQKPSIHPFIDRMAANSFAMARIIVEQYGGDARAIWQPAVRAGELITRLQAFPGIGEHKARIALFVATVQLGIVIKQDGGDYSIRSCQSLAQLFHPLHQPILT